MESKNTIEQPIQEVYLKEVWNEWLKKRKIIFIFLLLFFFVIPLLMVIVLPDKAEGIALSIVGLLFVGLINIPTIRRLFYSSDYVVKIEGGKLIVFRNGTEKLSITPSATKKIIMVRQLGDILSIGIYEQEPGFLSSGKGYRINLSFIPQKQIQNLIKFLQAFYGNNRFLMLLS